MAFRNGDAVLSGSLLSPQGSGPFPGVILLHGSGAAGRHFYRVFPAHFARNGIAALIYDERGYGESGGRQDQNTLSNMAEDARAGVRFLAEQEIIEADQIGVWGFSQGGRLLPMVAASNNEVAFVIAVSAPGISAGTLDLWQQDQISQEGGQLAWIRSFALFNSDLRQRIDAWRKGDNDLFMEPTVFWEQVAQPASLLYGKEDQVIPPDDSAYLIGLALEKGENSSVTLSIHPNADHDLMLVGSAIPSFIPGYLPVVAEWVQNDFTVEVESRPVEPTGLFDENGCYGPGLWSRPLMAFVGLLLITGMFGWLLSRSNSGSRHR